MMMMNGQCFWSCLSVLRTHTHAHKHACISVSVFQQLHASIFHFLSLCCPQQTGNRPPSSCVSILLQQEPKSLPLRMKMYGDLHCCNRVFNSCSHFFLLTHAKRGLKSRFQGTKELIVTLCLITLCLCPLSVPLCYFPLILPFLYRLCFYRTELTWSTTGSWWIQLPYRPPTTSRTTFRRIASITTFYFLWDFLSFNFTHPMRAN